MITFIGYDRHHPPDVSLDKSSANPHIPQTVVEKNDGESQILNRRILFNLIFARLQIKFSNFL